MAIINLWLSVEVTTDGNNFHDYTDHLQPIKVHSLDVDTLDDVPTALRDIYAHDIDNALTGPPDPLAADVWHLWEFIKERTP